MGLISILKNLFGGDESGEGEGQNGSESTAATALVPDKGRATRQVSLPMTEEEKTEVAIISAVIAGQHHPGAKFHVTQITRVQ